MEQGFTSSVDNRGASSLVKLGRYEKIISAVTKSVHSSIDINEVYENAVDALMNNIEAVLSSAIYIVEGDYAVLKGQRGVPERLLDKLSRIPRPRGYVWKTILDAKLMYTPDTDIDTVIGPAGKEMGIKSYISMPLKGKEGAVIGVINLNSPIKHAFEEAEMKLLDIVATQIEVAIATAHQASALIESESRFRNMADTTPTLLWMSDPEMHCTYFNKGWLDFTGRTLEEELEKGWSDIVHPDDLEGAVEIYSSAFDARREFKVEYRLLHHTGEYRWLLDQGVPRYMPDGTFAGYIGSCIDITEMKNAGDALKENMSLLEKKNRYDAIIGSVSRSVHKSLELQEVLDNAAESLIENFEGAESTYIYLVEGDEAVLKSHKGVGKVYIAGAERISRPRGVTWKTLLAGKTLYIPDADVDPDMGPAGKKAGIKSVIITPIMKDDQAIGTVHISSFEKEVFGEDEFRTLEIVTEQIAIAIQNASQTEALVESESRFRNMADTTPALIWRMGTDNECDYFNQVWLDFTGRTMVEELGHGWAEMVHPDDRQRVIETCSTAFNAQRKFQMEYRLRHHTGEYRWLLDQGVPRYMPDGTFAGYIGSCIDVNEMKKAEEALKENLAYLEKKNRYEEIVGTVSRSIHKSLDLQEVLDNAVVTLTENFDGAESIFIYLVEGDEAVLKSSIGIGDVYKAGAGRIPRPKGVTWKTILEGKTLNIPDADIDPDIGPAGKKAGIKSLIVSPIMKDDQAIGTINIGSFHKHTFGTDEFRTLETVTGQIAIAIHNASQAEALIKSEGELLNSRDELETRVEVRTTALKTANDSLIEEINEKKRAQKDLIEEINERKRAQKDLMFIQFAIENVSDSAFWIKDSGQIYYANQAACDTLGYTRDELLGKTVIDIKIGVTLEMFDALFKRVKEQGAITFASVHFRKDGTSFPVEINANFMKYEGEEFVCSIVRDITERKRTEEEMMKAQKLESLSVFAGGIAHDFNNLLTGIMGNISLAKLDVPKADKKFDILHEAQKASERARDLTYQLLTFAKGGEPVRHICNISKLLRESVTFASRGSNVKVDFATPEDLWHALIDEGQINQVVYNIVLNAIQAMPHGGNLQVHAQNHTVEPDEDSTLEPGKYVKICVGDDGVGMPAEILNNIFDPFYTTKQMGSGLGLATSYSIIKRHGGNIEVETTEGEGTVFHFYLPAAAGTASKEESSIQTEMGKMRGKILVMDDEALIRLALKEMLTYLGYEVTTAKDGEEAIEAYKDLVENGSKFDVAILDITIPGGMGGKEAIQFIKAELDPDVKAVVSSGYSTSAIIADYMDYGFIDYLAKPYKIEDLTVVLDRIINS